MYQTHIVKFQNFKLVAFTVFLLVFCFASYFSNAQSIIVKGKITDQFNLPVSGVTIQENNTEFATLSKGDGSFEFFVSNLNAVLKFQKRGFQNNELLLSQNTFKNVVLTRILTDTTKVETEVNNGFFKVKKLNTSSSSSSFYLNELQSTGDAINDILDKLPGVDINSQGEPGGFFTTQIRGSESVKNNEPLIILDGMVLVAGINLPSNLTELNQLAFIHSNDIENVTVLKDAAATAIYGSQGANGVILIETKSGVNKKFSLNFYSQSGVQLANTQNNLLNGGAYINILNESLLAAGLQKTNLNETVESVDWAGDVLRTGFKNNFALSLSGGNKKSGFYASGKMNNIIGVLGQSKFNDAGFHFKSKTELTSWLLFNVGLNAVSSKQNGVSNPANQFSANPFSYAQQFPPLGQNVISNNELLSAEFYENDPVQHFENMANEAIESRYSANFEMILKFNESLMFSSKVTSDYSNFYSSSDIYGTKNKDLYFGKNTVQEKTGILYNWYINNTLKYQNSNDKHSIILLLGSSENYLKATQDVIYKGVVNTELFDNSTELLFKGKNSRRTGAIFAQAVYSLDKRWNLAASFRREKILRQEGTELFGLFPSVTSGFWFFRKKDELQKVVFSGVKLKMAWGISGAESLMGLNYTNDLYTKNINNTDLIYIPNELFLPNMHPNSRWELTEEWDFGWQANFLNDKLVVEFDYFDRLRSNVAFTNIEIDSDSEVYNWYNSARIHNSGWEFQVNYKTEIEEVKLNLGLDILSAKNSLLSLGDAIYVSEFQNHMGFSNNLPLKILKVGEEIGLFQGYVMDGIFQNDYEIEEANLLNGDESVYYQNENTAPGDIRFKDLDQNGIINENDVTSIGSSNPDFTYGISLNAVFDRFDCSVFIDGAAGNEVYNLNKVWGFSSGGVENRFTEINEYWTPLNLSNSIARVHFSDPNNNNRLHSGMIENAGFFRLRKLDFGYTFKQNGNNRNLRAYLSFVNLFTLSSYSGDYPEIGYQNGTVNYTGLDYGWYPNTTSVLVGFQIKL